MKNRILIGFSLVLLVACGWWATLGGGSRVEALSPGDGVAASSPDSEAVIDGPEVDRARSVDAESEVREAMVDVVPVLSAMPETWAGELGGIIGRVVEEDGSAVVGISVAFLQADGNLILAADLAELGEEPPEFILERAITDDEGRFRMGGAYDGSFHGLGIDLRGPRCTLRVVDTQLHHREVTDLGDIVLRAGCTVTGRVTDEGGGAVEGVRVRLVPIAPDGIDAVITVGPQDFRSDSAVGISKYVSEGSHSPVVEPPPLVRRHLADLPLPTTVTDADGAYRFEGAPVGDIMIAIDKRGWLGMLRRDQTEPGEVELADAILRGGRTISGEVIDSEGDPVAGVEVMAGTEIAGMAAILQPAGMTDEDGRFSVSGCPLVGNMMACARRATNEPWTGVIGASVEDLEIELEVAFDVVVHLVDLAGKPVTDARVTLEPGFEEHSPMLMMMHFKALGQQQRPSRFKETEPGVYTCADVTPGMYEVRARPTELNAVRRTVELWPGQPELTLVCEPGQYFDVTVVDNATGKPVSHARASVVQPGDDMFFALAVGRTNSKGLTRLGPCTSRAKESRRGRDGETQVVVQHPRYADAAVVVHDDIPTAEVRLSAGSEVRGRVEWGANPPQQIYMVVLERRPDADRNGDISDVFLPPRIGRTGLDGTFRFSNLPSGTYSLELFERWLGGDPLDFALKGIPPVLLYRDKELIVAPEQPLEVVIDLGPTGAGATARVAGSVRVDGSPVEGATVRAYGSGAFGSGVTDADGYYETTPFLVGESTSVMVFSEVDSQKRQLFGDKIDPIPGEVYRLDVDTNSAEVRIRVTRSEDGQPISGAKVSLALEENSSRRSAGKTNADGEVTLTVVGDGSCQISVNAPGRSETTYEHSFEAREMGTTVEIELPPSVPCAGVCDFTNCDYSGVQRAFLRITGGGDSKFVRLEDSDVRASGRVEFEVDGLGPGEYNAVFYIGDDWSDEITFELSDEGATDLVLSHP